MIVTYCLLIELLAIRNIKCPVRLEMTEEDCSGRVLHGQSIKHMKMLALNWEELLIYPRCSVLCWFAAWVGALRPCLPFLQWELGFLGLLTPAAELLALGSLSEGRNGRGCEGKHREQRDSRVKGSKSVFSMTIRKEKCLCHGIDS